MSSTEHTPEDWADGKIRTRENNPIYSGPYTMDDYRREFKEAKGRKWVLSKEGREFKDRYLKRLNEEDDGPEAERYKMIVREALSRYDGPRAWGHGFGNGWEPDETTERRTYYTTLYELTDEDAIESILTDIEMEAERWTFLDSIYDEVLQELNDHPEWAENEREIWGTYNHRDPQDADMPDAEKTAEDICESYGGRYLDGWIPDIRDPKDPDDWQECERIAIETIVSKFLEDLREQLEAARTYKATGKVPADRYSAIIAIIRTTRKIPTIGRDGEILALRDILDIGDDEEPTLKQDLPLASSVPPFRPDELQPRNRGMVLERHSFTSKLRTAPTIEEVMDGLGLDAHDTKLESREFKFNNVDEIKANLFVNSLVGRPSELEIDLALQIGLYLEGMVEKKGKIEPIGVYDLIRLFYGIPSGLDITAEHAKEMDRMLNKLMATKIYIDPLTTNLPKDGILKGAIGIETPLLSYTRIVYLNDDRKTTVSKYLFDRIPILWTVNKAIGLYTLTDLELITTPTYAFDSEDWKNLDMDAGTRRRIIQHHDKEGLIMRRDKAGLYLHPYKTLEIKKWVLKNLGITVSYDRDRKYGTVILNLEQAYKDIKDEDPPKKKSMKWFDFKKRVQMYLLYLMAWGYIEDYTPFTTTIQIRYSDRAKVQIADVIRNP